MKTVDLERWRGPRDEVALDPATVVFREQAAKKGCKHCVFARQWSGVCDAAIIEAKRRGMHSCEDGFVYVEVETDPRQLTIEK